MSKAIVINNKKNLISETNFSNIFRDNKSLLVVSSSPEFAGSLFEISKGRKEEDIKLRFLDQTSEIIENNLSFDETLSCVVNREAFENLVELYEGENLLSILFLILEEQNCELEMLVESVMGIYNNSVYSIEFILQTLLSAERSSVESIIAQELDFSAIV